MKLRDGVLLIVLVLLFVILAYLLSSKNPKKGLFAPILVPIRGWFGGHGHSGGNSVVVVGGAGGAGGGTPWRARYRAACVHRLLRLACCCEGKTCIL